MHSLHRSTLRPANDVTARAQERQHGARERRRYRTLRRRSHAAVEANTGNIPSWLPSFESSCDATVSQQRNATTTRAANLRRRREGVDDAPGRPPRLCRAQAHAARQPRCGGQQEVAPSFDTRTVRHLREGIKTTSTKRKQTVLWFRMAHLADHTARARQRRSLLRRLHGAGCSSECCNRGVRVVT
jgi:hypothetical protein